MVVEEDDRRLLTGATVLDAHAIIEDQPHQYCATVRPALQLALACPPTRQCRLAPSRHTFMCHPIACASRTGCLSPQGRVHARVHTNSDARPRLRCESYMHTNTASWVITELGSVHLGQGVSQ